MTERSLADRCVPRWKAALWFAVYCVSIIVLVGLFGLSIAMVIGSLLIPNWWLAVIGLVGIFAVPFCGFLFVPWAMDNSIAAEK